MDLETIKAAAKKARQSEKTIGDVTFYIRRPSDLEQRFSIRRSGGDIQSYMHDSFDFVYGWKGVPVGYFVKNIGQDEAAKDVEFDRELLIMWLNDHQDSAVELSNHIWQLLDDVEKEKKPSSTTLNSNPV